jgi:hypothetical protein
MTNHTARCVILILLALAGVLAAKAAPQAAPKIDRQKLMNLVTAIQGRPDMRQVLEDRAIENMRSVRLDFTVTEEVLREMRQRGASDRFIQAARECGPNPQEILRGAEADFAAGRFKEAAAAAMTAAGTAPSGRAWELAGDALARGGDTAGAREAYLKSLAAGGTVSARVWVAPAGDNFRSVCKGTVAIGKGRLRLEAPRPCEDFDSSGGRVVAGARNEFVGVDKQSFHVTVEWEGKTRVLSLAPFDGSPDTTAWLLKLLEASRLP